MDHLEAAGWVAADRGIEHGGVTLRPRDATTTFRLPDGSEEVLNYDELIAEGERLRAARRSTARPPRTSFSFRYPDPFHGGRR